MGPVCWIKLASLEFVSSVSWWHSMQHVYAPTITLVMVSLSKEKKRSNSNELVRCCAWSAKHAHVPREIKGRHRGFLINLKSLWRLLWCLDEDVMVCKSFFLSSSSTHRCWTSRSSSRWTVCGRSLKRQRKQIKCETGSRIVVKCEKSEMGWDLFIMHSVFAVCRVIRGSWWLLMSQGLLDHAH